MWREAPRGQSTLPRTLAIVDAGTHKVVVLLLAADGATASGWRIAGVGHQLSHGIKARVVVQTDEAAQAVKAALTQAERMAGLAADAAIVTYGGGRLRTVVFDMTGAGADGEVIGIAQQSVRQEGLAPLFADVSYDGRGARTIRVQVADEGPVKALAHVVERADLAIAGVLPSALTAGLAVTTAEERGDGVIALDLGAGASTAACFSGGRFTGSIAVPVGGATMTYDVARELQVPITEAERIKLSCGTLTRAQSFVHGALRRALHPSPSDGDTDHEGATIQIQIAHSLIAERAQSLIGLVADRLQAGGPARRALRSVVLTGGVSQMDGFVERAEALFGVPVRVGRPQDPGQMFVDSLMTPAFATAIGVGHVLAGAIDGAWQTPARDAGIANHVRGMRPGATATTARSTVKGYV